MPPAQSALADSPGGKVAANNSPIMARRRRTINRSESKRGSNPAASQGSIE